MCIYSRMLLLLTLSLHLSYGENSEREGLEPGLTGQLVEDQYNHLPYPPFSKQKLMSEERHYSKSDKPVVVVRALGLDQLNHYLYKGEQKYEKNFRFLNAGGGTGSVINYMGEQLRGKSGAELVYLDLSRESRRIAMQRAKYRKLNNIKWLQDRIENIPHLNIGKFDLVECSGVLHHLTNPQSGLRILSNSLVPGGGMVLMVYSRYGRVGLYHIQDVLKIVNENITDREAELENTWAVLESFPHKSRGLRINNSGQPFSISGRRRDWDAEIYDRYCHKQDTAYTVEELYELVESANLEVVDHFTQKNRLLTDISWIEDPEFHDILSHLDTRTQAGILALITGTQNEHTYYLSKQGNTCISLTDPGVIPHVYDGSAVELLHQISSASDQIKDDGKVLRNFQLQQHGRKNISVPVWVSKYTRQFVELLGRNLTVAEMYEEVSDSFEDYADFLNCFQDLYESLRKADFIILKKS